MSWTDVLGERRGEVEARWRDLILSCYPEESAKFYSAERDPFRNPVGATVRRAVPVLLGALAEGTWDAEAESALEAIVRLRSVQGFPASRALGFIPGLKAILRGLAATGRAGSDHDRDALDERVDGLVLRGADCFVACRERIHELREHETKARVHSLLRRAGMLAETAESADAGSSEGSSR